MLDDIFKAVLKGAQGQSQAAPEQQTEHGNILEDLLKGVLKGQQPSQKSQQRAQQQDSMMGMADILGGILGGMGGNTASSQANPLVAPIANMLSEKLGISPAIAGIIINYALSALLSRGKKQPGQVGQGQQDQGFDLDDLLKGDFAWSSGMAQQLSNQTGLSEDDAAYGLQEAMVLLSGNPAAKTQTPRRKPRPRNQSAAPQKGGRLDNLLDSWETD